MWVRQKKSKSFFFLETIQKVNIDTDEEIYVVYVNTNSPFFHYEYSILCSTNCNILWVLFLSTLITLLENMARSKLQ